MDQGMKGAVAWPAPIPAEQLLELWQMPLRLWFSWWETCFLIPSAHHLSKKERVDRKHAQLVIPEPLKARVDRELFA